MDRPRGFQEVEAPRFQDYWHMKAVRLSAVCTGRLHPPGNIPGTHFSWRLSRPQGHSVAGRMSVTFWLGAHCLNHLCHHVPIIFK